MKLICALPIFVYDSDANKAYQGLNAGCDFCVGQSQLSLSRILPLSGNLQGSTPDPEMLEPRLCGAWPREGEMERRAFGCIRRAYVEVRYGRSYRIGTGELAWAIDRTVMLHNLVGTLCAERLPMSATRPGIASSGVPEIRYAV